VAAACAVELPSTSNAQTKRTILRRGDRLSRVLRQVTMVRLTPFVAAFRIHADSVVNKGQGSAREV
jgi:hypothetical protein